MMGLSISQTTTAKTSISNARQADYRSLATEYIRAKDAAWSLYYSIREYIIHVYTCI